jgi:hypothetical protein
VAQLGDISKAGQWTEKAAAYRVGDWQTPVASWRSFALIS